MFIKMIILLILIFNFNLYADIVKWVDKNGQVHYSNKAPKKLKKSAKKIKFVTYKKPDKNTEVSPPTPLDRSIYSTEVPKRQIKRKPKVKKPTLAELKVDCEMARQRAIAPIQQKIIEECVETNRMTKRPRDYCEGLHSNLGDQVPSNHWIRRKTFLELPECIKVFEAEKKKSRLMRGYD